VLPISADRTAGFTLLEVVIALAIAALALVVLFRAGGEGLFAADSAARAEEAVERAQSHLAAVGHDAALLAGESEGEDGDGYRWHVRVQPVASWPIATTTNRGAPAFATLFDVEVAETWPGRGHDRAVTLRTRRIGVAPGSE